MKYTWNFQVVFDHLDVFARAASVTVGLSGLVILLGTMLGLPVARFAMSGNIISKTVARIFTDTFLAIPVLVLLIWIYFCLPILAGINLSSYLSALLGLTLSLAAFVSEILRSGMGSVSRNQIESAILLGLNNRQITWRIVMPQALRSNASALAAQYVTVVKLSSLASVISVEELVHSSRGIVAQTYRPLEVFTAMAIIYLLLVIPLVYLVRYIENRTKWDG